MAKFWMIGKKVVHDRPLWRVTIKNTCKRLNEKRVDQYKQKKSKELEREPQKSFSVYFLLLFDQELVYLFL